MTSLGSHFYFPPSRLKFISTLQSQLEGGRVVAVEGATGTGKTVVLEELLTTVLPNANKCYVTAGKQINDIQFRGRVIEQLFGNVLFDPEKPLITSFLEFNQYTELLLVIDNVHFLSGQIIGELLQLFSELNKAGVIIAVVMSFDKTISTTLLNVNSSILSVNSVPLLSFEESYQLLKEYVEDLPAANNGRVKRWIENAQGVPIQLLAYDQESDLVVTSNSLINVKLWGAVIVASSVILALVIHGYNTGFFSQQLTPESEPEAVVKPWNQPSRLDDDQTQPYSVSANSALPATQIDTASSEEIYDIIAASIDSLDKIASDPQPIAQEATESAAEQVAEQPIQQPPNVGSEMVSDLENDNDTASDVSNSDDEVQQAAIAPDNTNVLTEDKSDQIDTTQTQTIYKIDNRAFFSLPSDQFVLQLTAVSSEATLTQYLQSAGLDRDKVKIYKVSRNNQDWIVVTYGLYRTIADARADAADVEPKAWAKSVAVIQQQISSYQTNAVN